MGCFLCTNASGFAVLEEALGTDYFDVFQKTIMEKNYIFYQSLCSSGRVELSTVRIKVSMRETASVGASSGLGNELPQEPRAISDLSTFHSKCKVHVFDLAFVSKYTATCIKYQNKTFH